MMVIKMKISSTNRSAAWLHFDWHNGHESDYELSWGAEEEPSDGDEENAIFFGINFGLMLLF